MLEQPLCAMMLISVVWLLIFARSSWISLLIIMYLFYHQISVLLCFKEESKPSPKHNSDSFLLIF